MFADLELIVSGETTSWKQLPTIYTQHFQRYSVHIFFTLFHIVLKCLICRPNWLELFFYSSVRFAQKHGHNQNGDNISSTRIEQLEFQLNAAALALENDTTEKTRRYKCALELFQHEVDEGKHVQQKS